MRWVMLISPRAAADVNVGAYQIITSRKRGALHAGLQDKNHHQFERYREAQACHRVLAFMSSACEWEALAARPTASGTETVQLAPQALQRLYMVELMLDAAAFRDGTAAGPSRRLPENLRRLCAEAWQDRLYQNASSSRFQQHVRRILLCIA